MGRSMLSTRPCAQRSWNSIQSSSACNFRVTRCASSTRPPPQVCGLNQIPFTRERSFWVQYKTIVLPHKYYADFVVFEKILLETKAVERLTDSHVKQVLNYLAASKLKLGLLINFGEDSLTWKR